MDITKASTSSIMGVVTKQDWFGSFYTSWTAMQANEQLKNKLTEAKIEELDILIEEVKNNLDNENIVY